MLFARKVFVFEPVELLFLRMCEQLELEALFLAVLLVRDPVILREGVLGRLVVQVFEGDHLLDRVVLLQVILQHALLDRVRNEVFVVFGKQQVLVGLVDTLGVVNLRRVAEGLGQPVILGRVARSSIRSFVLKFLEEQLKRFEVLNFA